MVRKFVSGAARLLTRRRRFAIVASLPVVLGALALALAGAVGTGTTGKGAAHSYGIARASAVGGSTSLTSSTTTDTSFGPHVIQGTFDGESPAVSSLPVLPVPQSPLHALPIESLTPSSAAARPQDPVVQKTKGVGPISGPIQNFDGICLPFGPPCALPSSCSCLPPDTDGEVGATQYVQMVNTDFAVFSKSGQVLRTATPINELFANTDGECKTHNDGDPVVVYDQLANRWVLSQFIATPSDTEEYGQCFAVSTTSDATGSYYLYEFHFGRTFHDYEKIGVWPDAYYMSSNEFPDGQVTSAGAGAMAFERAKMLAGEPARMIFFDEAAANPPGGQYIGQLPGDLDGSSLPPAGSPNLFAEVDDATSVPPTDGGDGFVMRLWKFHVDWTNPDSSTFGQNDFPSVRYTGRAAGDPLGQMTQAEQVAYTGTGPQTEVEGRWGDYSDLTVDPADDCTFWYTQEYLAEDVVLLGTWRTRIVSFKFPGCR